MPRRVCGTTAKRLLAAWVLAWTVFPPVLRHSHAGGEDATHHHDPAAHHAYAAAAREHLDAADPLPSEAALRPASLSGFAVHLHWTLGGWTFSVPTSPDDRPDGPPEVALVAGGGLAEAVPVPIAENSGPAGWAAVPGRQLELVTAAVQTWPPLGPGRMRAGPLCDRARQERSGVLVV